MVSKCCCGGCSENCKQNGSWWMRASSWVGSILKSNRENVIPDGLYCRISDASFISFPEALRNAEAERISTKNALFINFIIYFSASCNADYVSIGTSLSTSVIKSDTLWSPLKESNEEVSRLKPDFFFLAISEISVNWMMEIGYWFFPYI